MKCVICQCSFQLGDIQANQKKIENLAGRYQDCDLLIFPEMSLTGYPLEDLLEQKHFIQKQQKILKKIQLKTKKTSVLFGSAIAEKHSLFNSAVFINKNQMKFFYKSYLAVTDTFDEMRFFSPARQNNKILSYKNKNILILICEDLWKIQKISVQKKIDFIICINASPFFPEQINDRLQMGKKLCQQLKAPLIYVNQVGGQDEWIFDGSSFVLNKKGEPVVQCPSFKEHIEIVETEQISQKTTLNTRKKSSSLALKRSAIQLGIRDFISKNGLKKIHLGLSGGADSALVAALCCEALGPNNVTAFFLKGPYTASISRKLSLNLAKELGLQWREQSIIPSYRHFISLFKKLSPLAKENIQARIRALFLMAYSNTYPSFLVGTSNKSELATGYGTLYGDLAGAFFPIGDLYKTEVQQMIHLFYLTPTTKKILQRPPSAELSKGQKDQDDLPPYEQLDPILKNLIEKTKAPKSFLEKEIFYRLLGSEFKRRQSPFVLKVSSKAFGKGRRYPLTLKI